MEQVNAHNPDAVFVDAPASAAASSIGWPARLLNRRGVISAARPTDRVSDAAARYANKRAEMWGGEGLVQGGRLPDDRELEADLTESNTATTRPTRSCSSARRTCGGAGLASPDDADALALTFAYPVARRDWAEERRLEEALARLKRWVV